MAWTPTRAILTPRAIPDNVLDYITDDARQEAALIWAGGSGLKKLKTSADIRANPKLPEYPMVEYTDDNDEQSFVEDMIPGVYSFVLKFWIQGSDIDTVIANARCYSKAVMSMILNCPESTLKAGTGCTVITVENMLTGFDFLKFRDGKMLKDCMQVFEIKTTVSLIGSAFV